MSDTSDNRDHAPEASGREDGRDSRGENHEDRSNAPTGAAAAAPIRRPSSVQSSSRSSMPGASGETHQLYIEIASLQMAKARQQRIRDALEEQVDKCRRAIADARERTRALKARAEMREPTPEAEDDTDHSGDEHADDTETYRY